jgi:PAS domain S-box-containing protein
MSARACDGEQIAAFRVLRSALACWWKSPSAGGRRLDGQARWYLSPAAGVVFILLMTAMAVRSLRAREAARRALDAAQSEVIARERELSAIFGSVQELLFRTDAQGTLTFINAPWAQAGGQAQRAAVGSRLQDLVMPDSRDAVAALFAPEGQQRPRHALARLLGPDGQVRRFEMTVVPLDALGSPTGLPAVAWTSRRSRGAVRVAGATGFGLFDRNPLLSRSTMRRAIASGSARPGEDFNGTLRDNTQLGPADLGLMQLGVHCEAGSPGRLHARPARHPLAVAGRGQPAGIVTAFMDISEIRDAERILAAREAAEDASRADRVIANVSRTARTIDPRLQQAPTRLAANSRPGRDVRRHPPRRTGLVRLFLLAVADLKARTATETWRSTWVLAWTLRSSSHR